jgi:periplasmic mercuric ion binding protein
MKTFLLILVFVLATGITHIAEAQKKSDPVVHFKSNMDCVECEKTLFEYLRFEKGVKDLKVDHVSNTIKVVYAEKRTGSEALKKAVEKKGYIAEKINEEEYSELFENASKQPHNQGHGH